MSVIVFVADVSLDIVCSTQSMFCSAVSTSMFRFRYESCHLFRAKWLIARSADTAEGQLSFKQVMS